MRETTWIIDAQSGALTVEGLKQSELAQLATDLLAPGKQVNCARPINIEPLRLSSAHAANGEPSLRVFRIYHNSVVEGPGRRSVLQTAGCLLHCTGCIAVETWPLDSAVEMEVREVVERVLDPEGEPRDGVTVLGGEPFLQLDGLLALMKALKRRGQHVTLYTGYILEELTSRRDARIEEILALTYILIDGPFVKELAENAGEWRGSTNRRIIHSPSNWRSVNCTVGIKSGTRE
jgi:anaerobic ribonucleoside-triphosphate reductase activating protein